MAQTRVGKRLPLTDKVLPIIEKECEKQREREFVLGKWRAQTHAKVGQKDGTILKRGVRNKMLI